MLWMKSRVAKLLRSMDAAGRVLAEPQGSNIDVPSLDNSAMDGFAVRLADLGRRVLLVSTDPASNLDEVLGVERFALACNVARGQVAVIDTQAGITRRDLEKAEEARDMAEALRKPLGGATVVVENVLGAGGAIATQKVAKAAPDGHTILIHHIGMATMPTLVRKPGFQVDTDFTYLGMINDVPMTLISKPQLPANNYKELLGWVQANKGRINLANAGLGAASHLCGLMFMSLINTDLTTVPYKGTAASGADLIAGRSPEISLDGLGLERF